jgi:hypothetical protein
MVGISRKSELSSACETLKLVTEGVSRPSRFENLFQTAISSAYQERSLIHNLDELADNILVLAGAVDIHSPREPFTLGAGRHSSSLPEARLHQVAKH